MVCLGSSISVSETVTGGTWGSSAPGIASVDLSGNVTGAAVGTANITYSYTNVCGTATSSAFPVTVNSLPSAITGTLTTCIGSTISLSSATGGGTWSTGGAGVATVDPSLGIVTGAASGTETISYTLGCGYISAIVSVNGSPASFTGDSSVCQGSTASLTSVTPGGTWATGNPGIATVAGGVVLGNSAGITSISYTTTCGTVSVAFTVNAAPSAISSVGSSVCEAGTIMYTDATIGGTWSSSDPGTASVDVSGNVTGVLAGVATISYNTGCGTAAIRSITVLAAPQPITGMASL